MNDLLNDETRVPIKWVFILLSASGSALITTTVLVLWFSNVAASAADAKEKNGEQDVKIDKQLELMHSIDKRLSNIEGALHIKAK